VDTRDRWIESSSGILRPKEVTEIHETMIFTLPAKTLIRSMTHIGLPSVRGWSGSRSRAGMRERVRPWTSDTGANRACLLSVASARRNHRGDRGRGPPLTM
jgi:hypothetical protein